MAWSLSPLRYPGGKSKLAVFVEELVHTNRLEGCTYVEPFAGGCGIAWYLLSKGVVKSVHLNDLSQGIYSFWFATLNHTDELCHKIQTADVSVESWREQKEIYRSEKATVLERAFATLFLNRTNRSGIITGGVIGGLDQTGNYKIDCRFNRSRLVEQIRAIAGYKGKVGLSQVDGEEFLREIVPAIPDKKFLNIDPPYFDQGRELYCDFLDHARHESLAAAIRDLDVPWMLTYDDTPEIRDFYAGEKIRTFGLTYTAQVKRKGRELLVLGSEVSDVALAPDISAKALARAMKAGEYERRAA